MGQGNGQGVVIDAYGTNTTLGGASPQDDNVIAGNVSQGVEIASGADGNQVLGNQIGVIGPSGDNLYYDIANGGQGILVESQSDLIGVAGAGNIISDNGGDGVEIEGAGATQNLVQANLIGAGPGGGYLFGSGNPGNLGDGVDIEDAPDNIIGGSSTAQGNTISSNGGAGVFITGASASGNDVSNNVIGLTSDGSQVLGNALQGVAVYSPQTMVGPGNVISANLVGVLISGSGATGITVIGNLIGTDITGKLDLGNEDQGVLIESASGVVVEGTAAQPQVISGNNVGVEIEGQSATGNLVEGNLIGTDKSGTLALPNSQQGILIEGAPNNTVGGTTAAARNVISANLWGIQLDGSTATGDLVEGNYIGTDVTGLLPLGNEIDGVIFSTGASNNTIGGTGSGQGNTIAFNIDDGVVVGPTSNRDGILSNRIFANGVLGIDLVPPGGNNLQPAPVLTSLTLTSTGVIVQGTLNSMPDTSYLIQFFLSSPGNSSTDGELLGATTVLTNANGLASFSVPLTVNISSGQGVLATATDPSNNTSEFSAEVVNQPAVIQFSMANYVVNAAAGVAVITVDREGGGGIVGISYATTTGGTALPAVNYTPVSGMLTFGYGVTVETFDVPIIDDQSQHSDKTVNLILTSPTGGAELGMPTLATLTITPPVPPPPAPTVTGVQLITNRQQIVTGIVVDFSELLNPTTAVNLLNYNYSVTTAGRNHVFGARDNLLIPINRAVYNPSNLTVTLTLGRGIHPPTPFRLAINQLTDVPGAGVGVSNLAGELLSTYVVVLKGNAGGIVPSTRQPTVKRPAPHSVAAVDAVIETGKVGATWVARAARDRRARAIDRRR